MKLSTINTRNKDVKKFNERVFQWDYWEWWSPDWKFELLWRRGNTFCILVSKKEMRQVTCGSGSFVSVGYTGGSWQYLGPCTVKVSKEKIEQAKNYEDLMRGGIISQCRYNVGKRIVYK